MTVCKICLNLDAEAGVLQRDDIKNATSAVQLAYFEPLERSARLGCGGCRLILQAIQAVEGGRYAVDSLWKLSTLGLHILLDTGYPVRIEYGNKSVEIFVEKGTQSSWRSLGQACRVSTNLDVSTAANLARGWLQRCVDEHPTCQKSCEGFMLKRVLHIGSHDSSVVRLCSSQPSTTPYVALSYCWGQSGNLTTTRETISTREVGVEWNDIPNTIRDAIRVTRAIGIEYLWVDALCIVQDDIADWEQEAANMAAVYEGATLVISATSAPSATAGFLQLRSTSANHRVWKLEPEQTGDSVPIHVREQLSHRSIIPDTSYRSDRNPLLSRGWAFQERLLARRTLHFLDSELIWECRSQYWCECSSCEVNLKWRSPSQRSSPFSRAMADPTKVDFTQLWHGLISDYSARQVTKIQDTLPALAGVVGKLQNLGMGQFCAGLWRKDIEYHLLWQADISNESPMWKRRLGPTWSWTSTPYPVVWATRDIRKLQSEVEIISVHCINNNTDDVLWRSEGGRIELLGRLTSATLEVKDDEYFLWKGSFGLRNPDYPPESQFFTNNPRRLAIFRPDVPCSPERTRPRRLKDGDTVSCILFYSTKKLRGALNLHSMGFSYPGSYSGDSRDLVWGGLAVMASKHDDNVYERVGIVEGEIYSQLESGWFEGIEKSRIELI